MKKKLVFTLAASFFCLFLHSQNVRVGVVAGLNVSSTSQDYGSSRLGFNAGLKSEFALPFLSDKSYLDAEILLSQKGYQDAEYYGTNHHVTQSTKIKESRYYLEVPLRYTMKFNLGEKFKLITGAGPYFAYGLTGKKKTMGNGGDTTVHIATGEVSNVFSDNLKRFDWGVSLTAGIEYDSRWQFSIGNNWGLKDANNTSDDLLSGKNKNFFVSVAYLF
jgi:hypothetical protein